MKALVAIGVSRCGGLTALPGAITDAERIANWARGQKFDVVVPLTDANGASVEVATIKREIKRLLDNGALEQLIICYSGHGFSPTYGAEVWLLSGWEDDGAEAIDASSSLNYARSHANVRIAFFADACRTTQSLAYQPRGTVIIPNAGGRPSTFNVDEFYAVPFGFPANEFSRGDLSFGIFTDEVLSGLEGKAASAHEARWRVTSLSLRDHLDKAVPLAASLRGIVQTPHSILQWRSPNDVYAEFAAAPFASPPPPDSLTGPQGDLSDDFSFDAVFDDDAPRDYDLEPSGGSDLGSSGAGGAAYRGGSSRGGIWRGSAGREDRGARAVWATRELEAAYAADRQAVINAETASPAGTAVFIGADLVSVSGNARLETVGNKKSLRLRRGDEPSLTMAGLKRPDWPEPLYAPIAIYPSLSASVRVDGRGVASVNYWSSGQPSENRATLRAVADATAMLRHGRIPDLETLTSTLSLLRHHKAENPALAIIAANLYHRLGRWDQVDDMLHFTIGDGAYAPFDLAVLATDLPADRRVVGRIPLFSSTWAAVDPDGSEAEARLAATRHELLPSLWTTLTRAGADELACLID